MHIVYVEDEPDIRELIRLALEDLGGFRVDGYAGGIEALEDLRRRAPPDLILLDVMMPDMDGRSLLAELRSVPDLTDVPVVFMTAKSLPSEIQALLALGAVGVISKPFDPLGLSDEIKAHLGHRPD